MTKFFKALDIYDTAAISNLIENDEIDIDENLVREPKVLHCLEYAIGKPELFIFLLGEGANPLCSMTAIAKEPAYLEIVLAMIGAGIESPAFPFVAKRLSSLRGREKTKFRSLLLKYDFPVPRDGVWCNQTEKECIANDNSTGLKRLKLFF